MAMSCSELPAPGASSCYSTLLPDSAGWGWGAPNTEQRKTIITHYTPTLNIHPCLRTNKTEQARLWNIFFMAQTLTVWLHGARFNMFFLNSLK